MAVFVWIPNHIGRVYSTRACEEVEADTVQALVEALDARYPGIGERLTEPDGRLRRWVHLFVDGQDVTALGGLAAPLPPGATLRIVPAVAGGSG